MSHKRYSFLLITECLTYSSPGLTDWSAGRMYWTRLHNISCCISPKHLVGLFLLSSTSEEDDFGLVLLSTSISTLLLLVLAQFYAGSQPRGVFPVQSTHHQLWVVAQIDFSCKQWCSTQCGPDLAGSVGGLVHFASSRGISRQISKANVFPGKMALLDTRK